MTHSYSLDLRVRVAAFVEAGHSRRAAARHFKVSDSFAIKLMQRQRQCGSPAPARQGRPRGTGKLACYEAFLIRTVEARAFSVNSRSALRFYPGPQPLVSRRRTRGFTSRRAIRIKLKML
jgi:hypothetical protein